MELTQYSIVLVNLNPTIGSEMKKTRPCVIISPDEMNKHILTVVIAPITSRSRPYPTRDPIEQAEIKGWIVVDQIRTVNKIRVIKKLGALTSTEIENVKRVILETYVE